MPSRRHSGGVTRPKGIADALSAQVDRVLLSGDAFVLRIAGNPKALAAVARVLPGVRSAEPNWVRVLHSHPTDLPKPNDTDFPLKWDLFNDGSLFDGSDTPTHGADINWLDAYDALRDRSFTATMIAILDTGIDASHPDLNEKLVPGWDFISNDSNPQDGFGHGTHVAGIAAAETNNGIGTAGVGFTAEVKIMPIKVCDDSGQCPSDAIANGITFAAANGAKVINMSFGGSEISPVEQTAINNAHSAGVLIVASAGNSNVATPNFPAAYEPVMAIAATDWDDGKASYSNFGADWVDLAAPGGDMGTYDDPEGIYSTMPTYNVFLTSCRAMGLLSPCYDLNYDQLAGTSMAAPQVAGAAALLFAINAGSNIDIRSLLQNNAEAVSGTGTQWANGRLDIGAAVAAVSGPDVTAPTVTSTSPANGATGVAIAANVWVTFSEPMNQATAQAAFALSPSVEGTFSWSGNTMTFDPTGLTKGTVYTATVNTTATDVAGNALAAEVSWLFTTTNVTTVTASPAAVVIQTGALRSGGVAQLATDDNAFFEVNSTTSGTRTTAWYGTFTGVTSSLTNLKVTYSGKSSRNCTQTVAIWRFTDSTWVQLNSQTVGTTEVLIANLAPAAPLTNYVSAGELRIRIRCTRSAPSFFASGDFLQITYDQP